MTSTKFTLGVLLMLLLTSIVGEGPLRGASVTSGTSQQAAVQGMVRHFPVEAFQYRPIYDHAGN